jgi:GWxTD domain-containing protein
LLIASTSQSQYSAPAIRYPAAPQLAVSLVTSHQEPFSADSARADIYLAMPFGALSFLYEQEKYAADYGIIVQISDPETGVMLLDKYQTKRVIESPQQRDKRVGLSDERADATQIPLTLKQGETYDIHITARDLNSKHEIDTTLHITVPRYSTTNVALSDVMLYRSRRAQRIVPLIGSDISILNSDEAGAFVELYNAPKGETWYVLERLTSPQESEGEWHTSSFFTTNGDRRQPLFLPFAPEDLWMGKYTFSLYILREAKDTVIADESELRKRSIVYVSRPLTMAAQRGIPIAETDLDEAIRQVEMIATGGAWDSLRDATTSKEKRQALLDFWAKQLPAYGASDIRNNEPMQVFYRRLQYANDHFGTDGWRSDRGRVYIQLGTPTNIDRHPYEAQSKPYEVWEYYDLNVRYYFVDQYLFGEYRLTSAPPPQGVFLWKRESY